MADIIAFPSRHLRPHLPPASPSNAAPSEVETIAPSRKLDPPSTGDAIARALLICATSEPVPLSDLPDCARVIGTAMRWIKLRGKARSSVPKLVLDRLSRHIDAGDPTAKLFSDWLDGRHLEDFKSIGAEHQGAVGVASDARPASDVSRGGE